MKLIYEIRNMREMMNEFEKKIMKEKEEKQALQ